MFRVSVVDTNISDYIGATITMMVATSLIFGRSNFHRPSQEKRIHDVEDVGKFLGKLTKNRLSAKNRMPILFEESSITASEKIDLCVLSHNLPLPVCKIISWQPIESVACFAFDRAIKTNVPQITRISNMTVEATTKRVSPSANKRVKNDT